MTAPRLDIGLLAIDPSAVDAIDPDRVPELLAHLERIRTLLWRILMRPTAQAERPRQDDRLLPLREAANVLGTTPDWLRRHANLPFVVRLSEGQVRYSARGIQRYIASRLGS